MDKKLRLTDREVAAIIKHFRDFFDSADHLWLFGSRTDMQKRGGDIDLYVETQESDLGVVAKWKIKFLVNLKNDIGDQKIDVVINSIPLQKKLPIYEEARKSGVKLV